MYKLLIAALLAVSLNLHADESKTEDDLDKLFTVMKMDTMVTEIYKQMQGAMMGVKDQLGITAEEMHIYQAHQERLTALMVEEMSFEKMRPTIRQIYMQNFTAEEIKAVLDFYSTSAGQAFIDKSPIVMQESMQLGMSMAQQAMPKIQALSGQLVTELEEFRKQEK